MGGNLVLIQSASERKTEDILFILMNGHHFGSNGLDHGSRLMLIQTERRGPVGIGYRFMLGR